MITETLVRNLVRHGMRSHVGIRRMSINNGNLTARVYLTGVVGSGAPKTLLIRKDGEAAFISYGPSVQAVKLNGDEVVNPIA